VFFGLLSRVWKCDVLSVEEKGSHCTMSGGGRYFTLFTGLITRT
jgi:hypothetical protein